MSTASSAETIAAAAAASPEATHLPLGLALGSAVFLSSALLFQIQPVLGKIILPWFGGSSAVWTACLMFFQVFLLAGYIYAHCLVRFLATRRQVLLHASLLALSFLFLPVHPSLVWRQASALDPTLRVTLLLGSTIGLPYFLLSATSPLLQSWYAAAHPGRIPYKLFAVSNIGSLIALLSFPTLVEPRLTTRLQSLAWSFAYAAFAVVCCVAGWIATRGTGKCSNSPDPPLADAPPLRAADLVLCVALCACGSALLLALTNHLTQNVAPVPLLWVLPLAVYLASFVACFRSDTSYRRGIWIPASWVALGAMSLLLHRPDEQHPRWAIAAFLVGLFACCMACHGETARRKPAPRHLTRFYLAMTSGGALGGIFVALLAPRMFRTFLETPLLLGVCAALVALATWNASARKSISPWWMRSISLGACAALAVSLGHHEGMGDGTIRTSVRNFYGALEVTDFPAEDDPPAQRYLTHGPVVHGIQVLDPSDRRVPTTYYSKSSGVGLAIVALGRRGAVRAGVIGLGAGVIASYCRPADAFEFYEINPAVVSIARAQFSFLEDCPGKVAVELGDARLTLESQAPQHFDLLAVDAFSSDAVPVHLLTREAFEQYFRHLRPDGILAVHITNQYLNLAPVVARNAAALGKHAIVVDDDTSDPDYVFESKWALLAADASIFEQPEFKQSSVTSAKVDPRVALWTDQFSNLFGVLQ